MFHGIARGLIVAAAGAVVGGMQHPNGLSNLFASKSPNTDRRRGQAERRGVRTRPNEPDETTGTVGGARGVRRQHR